jgi:hypothetical protein
MFEHDVKGRHKRQSPWDVHRSRLEVAYILRDNFRDVDEVKKRIHEEFKRKQTPAVVALALVEPNNPMLSRLSHTPSQIGIQFADWVAAVHLASVTSGPDEFMEVILAMVNRDTHGIWDFQDVINRAIVEKLHNDAHVAQRFEDKLASNPTVNERASLPRYLMSAGLASHRLVDRCRSLLRDEAGQLFPTAGYDAVDGSFRAISQSLLEVLAPSLSP